MTGRGKFSHRQQRFVSGVFYIACGLLGAACGGGSSPAPMPPVADGPVTFTDGGALAAQGGLITSLIEDTIDRASVELPVTAVKVTVSSDAARTIPGWGIGGYALGPNDIEIVVDPLFPNLNSILTQRLPHVVAHELHHTVRLRDPGLYITLREALIFEAMADHYAAALLDGPLPPWSDAFPEADTSDYLARAEPLLDQTFDFEVWFFGAGTDLPRWTGYTLGYRILRDYFDANPEENAVTAVAQPATQFFPPQTL